MVDEGVVVVTPAGDGGPSYTAIESPGQAFKGITVGAFDHTTGEVANFSARGPSYDTSPKPDLLAPGVNVVGSRVRLVSNFSQLADELNQSLPIKIPGMGGLDYSQLMGAMGNMSTNITFGIPLDDNYTVYSSTTAACAVVAGAAALLLSAYPLATPEMVKTALASSA
ncbi:MAG: S8 family serine peptidase [Promethearchaeota archaeon]